MEDDQAASTREKLIRNTTTEREESHVSPISPQHRSQQPAARHSRRSSRRWLPVRDTQELIWLGVVVLNAIPVILLAAYAHSLSLPLGSTGCLPDGTFVFPGTASIWSRSFFFTITIVLGRYRYSDLTFAEVKTIDVVWDTVVGRGGQSVAVYISYRVFNQALVYIMDSQPVSYNTYGAVAFESGSMLSLWHYAKALVKGSSKSNLKRWRIFSAMILTTAYVVAVPTLYSAMTGYTTLLQPSVSIHKDGGTVQLISYGTREGWGTLGPGGFNTAWGMCLDCDRIQLPKKLGSAGYVPADPLQVYWRKHEADYKAALSDPACAVPSRPECTSLSKPSTIEWLGQLHNLSSPLLDIKRANYDPDTDESNLWMCGSGASVFWSSQFVQNGIPQSGQVTGSCGAPSPSYQWGFSFLPLFIVCVLQFIWAVTMYGLWVENRRVGLTADSRNQAAVNTAYRPSYLVSAVAIVSQAEQHYGGEIKAWDSRELDRSIWRGSKGMDSTSK